MKIKLTVEFNNDLKEIINFIAKDKPIAARKFKSDLIKHLKKDLLNPFHFKKSIYFDDGRYRDYVFKGYIAVYEINSKENIVTVFGFIKYRGSL